jgi:hypothetical protein
MTVGWAATATDCVQARQGKPLFLIWQHAVLVQQRATSKAGYGRQQALKRPPTCVTRRAVKTDSTDRQINRVANPARQNMASSPLGRVAD